MSVDCVLVGQNDDGVKCYWGGKGKLVYTLSEAKVYSDHIAAERACKRIKKAKFGYNDVEAEQRANDLQQELEYEAWYNSLPDYCPNCDRRVEAAEQAWGEEGEDETWWRECPYCGTVLDGDEGEGDEVTVATTQPETAPIDPKVAHAGSGSRVVDAAKPYKAGGQFQLAHLQTSTCCFCKRDLSPLSKVVTYHEQRCDVENNDGVCGCGMLACETCVAEIVAWAGPFRWGVTSQAGGEGNYKPVEGGPVDYSEAWKRINELIAEGATNWGRCPYCNHYCDFYLHILSPHDDTNDCPNCGKEFHVSEIVYESEPDEMAGGEVVSSFAKHYDEIVTSAMKKAYYCPTCEGKMTGHYWDGDDAGHLLCDGCEADLIEPWNIEPDDEIDSGVTS